MDITVNGYIAREDGEEDFFEEQNWKDFVETVKKFGNCIFGRKTYDAVKAWGEQYGLDDLAGSRVIIVTTSEIENPEPYITVVHSPEEALKTLAEAGFTEALVSGGSMINYSFLKAKLVDELVLNINSIIVKKGMPFFSPEDMDIKLHLLNSEQKDQVITTTYKVEK